MKRTKPKLIAIVGGSGAGKTWLANQLQQVFGPKVTRLSLDDFYRDRSYLPAKRRAAINFDNPRAVDWPKLERVLKKFAVGKPVRAPRYDFATHTRAAQGEMVKPNRLIIMDGLWLLRRPSVRKFFSCGIFVDCPHQLRLLRRLNRDLAERNRDPASVRKQFLLQVTPMHERYVRPQQQRATLVITNPKETEINELAQKIKTLLQLN